MNKLVQALSLYDKTPQKPVNLYLGFLATSMDTITGYCFSQPYNALDFPGFAHPDLVALESIGSFFFVFQHFPRLLFFVRNLLKWKWLARRLFPESLAYGQVMGTLSNQIDELLANPASLEFAEHEIIYHHLLNPNSAKHGGSNSIEKVFTRGGGRDACSR